MFKRFKFLSAVSALFISITVLLAGCGGSSVPYKKDDTYIDSEDYSIKVTAKDEWKVKGYRNNEAIYKVEPMEEYKGGSYSVISITLKEKITNTDPWLMKTSSEYYIIVPTKEGFNSVYMGSSHPNDTQWKKFKKEYEKTSDKEGFLKKEFDNGKRTLKKFKKTS